MMTLLRNSTSIEMKTVGAVVSIFLLLLIAGVEPNPGPSDMLVFRYQYLLIDVGTKMLRKLFDVKVNNDLVQFLRLNPKFAKRLQFLFDNEIITDNQRKLLPPLDNNPDTANFDITLLICLLRNICGLKNHRDVVWQNPDDSDTSVEAEITRVKQCRNDVMHKGTVHISESEFNQKWKTLCEILQRLNTFCGIPNLTEMIDDIYSKPLDDQLKQQHDNILKAWHEAERMYEEVIFAINIRESRLMDSQSEIKLALTDQTKVLHDAKEQAKRDVTTLMDSQSEIKLALTDQTKVLHDAKEQAKRDVTTLMDHQSSLMDSQSEIKLALTDQTNELQDVKEQTKRDVTTLIDGQTSLIDRQSSLMDRQSEIKLALTDQTNELQDFKEQAKRILDRAEQHTNSLNYINSYTYDDNSIKECLKKSYETDFRTLCVTPLYNEDDRIDMLTIYTQPEMKHVPYHKARQEEGNYKISSYEQVFRKDNTDFRNIFVTGDAGMGKTSFGQFMSLLWSKAIAGDILANEDVRKDVSFMTKFDFVFYISLKETDRKNVVSMILDKYFYTLSKDEFETKQIKRILQTKICLVILDGLDEWRPDIGGNTNIPLPRKLPSDKCTYLTTCRPHIIETVRLSEEDIDHQVQITGFDHKTYVKEVIGYINRSQNNFKNPDYFLIQIEECGMDDQLHIPLITSQLIVVWLKYEISNMSRAMIYGSIIEMLFERAIIKKQIKPSVMKSADVQLPASFSKFFHLQKYIRTLEKVCLLSFLLLFDPKQDTQNLVFTQKQLKSEPYNISPKEIEYLCQLGIISKNKVIADFSEQEQMLSFLHISYYEFLAALFVSFFDENDLFHKAVKEIYIRDIRKYEKFLVLLSGISTHKIRLFFDIIYNVRKEELDVIRKSALSADHSRCNY